MRENVLRFWRDVSPDADNDTRSVRVASVTMEDLAQNIETAMKRVEDAKAALKSAEDQLEEDRHVFGEACKARGLFDGL